MSLLIAAPAWAQEDLGIPLEAPWTAPVEAKSSVAEKNKPALHPLTQGFWGNLAADLESMERWRGGLSAVLRHAEKRSAIFPMGVVESEEPLFEEYEAEAKALWERALDNWLSLETLEVRYGAFAELPAEGGLRAAAFSAVYSLESAKARFARDFIELAVLDPRLERLFNAPYPALGVSERSYSKIKARYAGVGFWAERAALEAAYAGYGKSAKLKFLPKAARRAYDARRAEDAKRLPRKARFRGVGAKTILAKAVLPVFAVRAGKSGHWLAPREEMRKPFLLPLPDWAEVPVSSRVIYALDTLSYWFSVASGTSLSSPISTDQLAQARERLLPGDLLLARREDFVGASGETGFWNDAGLYVGTAAQRKAQAGAWLPEDWPNVYGPCFEEGKSGSGCVLWAKPGGAVLATLERFSDGEALAALRPKGTAEERRRAARAAFGFLDVPYEDVGDVNDETRLGPAELLSRSWPSAFWAKPAEIAGVWSLSPNSVARAFDSGFGTDKEALEWILFLEAEPEARTARFAELEHFRSSWRRPKWRFAEEKTQ